ncbi:hypothetical protein [Streptomyces sp. NBC_00344]|uniref:hypothetical protein n=1 Tax=Streptomyces sp. NBC_00344 TaxID=2975720 RepID=UPI002E21FA7E
MNRFLSGFLAAGNALAQTVVLFSFRSVCPLLTTESVCTRTATDASSPTPGGFVVADTGHAAGYLPQLVFVVVSTVLVHRVLCGAAGSGPRPGFVLLLIGAALLSAGSAELVLQALTMDAQPPGMGWFHWYIQYTLPRPAPAPTAYALWCGWEPPVLLGVAVRLARDSEPIRLLLSLGGNSDDGDAGAARAASASPAAARHRWNTAAAGLVPVVLLAAAGGPVLRHTLVLSRDPASVTFDRDLWMPYRPPQILDAFRSLLYPALRLRPLRTETTAGWLATAGACLVLLAVLGAALYAVAGSTAGKRPLRVVTECWCATVFAAALAGVSEAAGLRVAWWQVSPSADARFFDLLGVSFPDAVRFGTVWGWAVGACVVCALWKAERDRAGAPVPRGEGGLSHAG